ncbi:hypothetical protein HMN09_01113000 [Mycena chlorophos]|uniref:Uncharacterized protein n=1 Tax=Mycena chlorophos TaxID=658473 RepID=A0A8H6SCY1_MYCCL|nr:hypothetical protein HMN09_01113000 [Mycena chlorophos]
MPMKPVANCPTAAEAELWAAYDDHGADFSAGDVLQEGGIDVASLERQATVFGILDPEGVARRLGFGDGSLEEEILAKDAKEDFLAEILHAAGITEPTTEEVQSAGGKLPKPETEYFPYPSKTMFLLDILDNLPRLRISSSLMRVFLWMLREAGASDVPSFDRLRATQKKIRAEAGIPSIPCLSPLGNVFFMNDPRAIIQHDWANPNIRKFIQLYPEVPKDGVIREIWHAEKWRMGMDLDMLSPMYDAGRAHFYVNELARTRDGSLVVPIRWIICDGEIQADSFTVSINMAGEGEINDNKTTLVRAANLVFNYYDLLERDEIPAWTHLTVQRGHPARMPNPIREIAGDDPIYTNFVDFFGDDVSGNRSKSWNKHWNVYMTNRNLPRKLLMQEFHTGIFHVHGIVSDDHLVAWRALGELSAMLWVPEIRDANQYHADLKQAVANLLDAVAIIDPSKIITKIKYHLLSHTPDDATAFGPLVGLATELFESFNAVFRYSSILSNHLAPSRDIALQLGDQEGLKHRLTGGLWLSSASNRWERAGPGVRLFLERHAVLQKLLGWSPQPADRPAGEKTRSSHALSRTLTAKAVNFSDFPVDSVWDRCKAVIAQSGDECRDGSWIFAELPTDPSITFPARIAEIWKGSASNILIVERFQLSAARDPVYGMPVLTRPNDEHLSVILLAANVKFIVNVQHDCHAAACAATGIRPVMQERVQSDKTERFIEHQPLERFILNTHSFHNAHLPACNP